MKQSLATTNQETVEGDGGLKIFFRTWHPDDTVHAIVVIVPGFNAHSGYYEWVAEQFVADGLAAGIRTANASTSKPLETTCVTSKRLRQS